MPRPTETPTNHRPCAGGITTGSDCVALVTGASAGLGAEICRRLTTKGWRVWAGSRSATSPDQSVTPTAVDVTDPHSVRAAVARIVQEEGRLDAVICNAGVQMSAPAEELPENRARAILDTNLWGAIHTIRATLPALRDSRGSIISIGSLAGRVAPPGEAYYAASKHGLRGFLESLRHEVRPQGIRVALIEPGYIRTALARGCAPDWPPMAVYDRIRRPLRQHLEAAIDNGMPPCRVADQVVKLAEARNPPFCSSVGASATWVPRLRRILPERLFFRIVASRFGIG